MSAITEVALAPSTEPRHVAIIDLGSNTGRLIALAYQPGYSYKLIDELRDVVRLAEGMGVSKAIRAEAFERGLDTLKTFKAYCDAVGVDDVCATATSAVRDAANGPSFLAAVEAKTGLRLRLLSSEAEACYGVLAVANSFTFDSGVVFDLGGGSAQLSLMQRRRFVRSYSWPLGAVRLSERFLLSDPPSKKELKALTKYVREALKQVDAGLGRLPLVGMGGTVRNLGDIQQKREGYPLDLLHGYLLRQEALDEIVEEIISKPLSERRAIPGLTADRADIIAAGALVVREIVSLLDSPGLIISGQGLREGLFYPYLLESEDHPLLPDVRDFSVHNLARRYYDRPAHNAHVRKLALSLFDQLLPLHGYGTFERELLAAAAIIHDIGMAVNYYDHHKHGYYLALSAALPGFSHREQALLALLVRFHRKGRPDPQGVGGLLAEGDMERVHKLAALLRLAEYLERSKAQRVRDVHCHLSEGCLRVTALANGDARIEIKQANLRSDLLARAYNVKVEVVLGRA
jgi:exopolyphosphatase/guanosine-5'-triphosphate,3'-diphosphate pyrophosphatase